MSIEIVLLFLNVFINSDSFRIKRYDQIYAEIGLPPNFTVSENANYDIVVYPDGGKIDFLVDDAKGYSYKKNKVKPNGLYLRCIACKATRVLHYNDNQVLLYSVCCL